MEIISKKSDTLGIISSSLCLVHCLTFPILMSFKPSFFYFISEEFRFLDFLFIILSAIAVYYSARSSHQTSIKLAFTLLFSLFVTTILLEDWNPTFKYLSYLASLGLIITHLINFRNCQRCKVHTAKVPA